VRLYVPSHELAGLLGEHRPEAKIVHALTEQPAPQRLHIYGEAGAGKTSLILRALADIARRENLARPCTHCSSTPAMPPANSITRTTSCR
jgi:ABC-type uncharacterized transport system fused permease/ATPase subunit